MSGGRPSKYDPAFCERIIAMGDEGKTIAEYAADLEISRETLNQYRSEYSDFSDAVKIAIGKAQAWWESRGRDATFGGYEGFSATSYIFQMKNRFRDDWRDKVEQEHSGALTVNIVRLGSPE